MRLTGRERETEREREKTDSENKERPRERDVYGKHILTKKKKMTAQKYILFGHAFHLACLLLALSHLLPIVKVSHVMLFGF